MSKLALVALAFVAIIVAISEVSAYRTTITTTTIEDNFFDAAKIDHLDNRGSPKQCRRQIPIQQVNHCQMHLTEGIIFDAKLKMVVDNKQKQQQQQHLQLCCNQLKKVDQQCQCDAIQVVFDEARQQGDVMESRQMLRKAQNLPNDCKLQVQECPLVSPRA
uniref:PawS-like protein 1b n=1 Tax=Senecio pinnatifolius var. maritimus TaxID=58528 RepID=A0A1V0JB54_9ASTR|nr:PawS-like protein 1b [Senecio pinnatifolius var. maritimus]